ncbi:MAG TPA: hypothetical protein VFV75_06625 [Candidatus Polarisedimenticolaceae bacterium]|nr:hypothetical protein [Candidatus Polarisedimenticolaceae bacterium]
MTMGTGARLAALVLATAATACGGGGGGSSDGGTTGGPQTGSFLAADTTPPADSVSLQAGTHSGLVVNVLVRVTDVDDFFGTGFRLIYDPTVAQYQTFDSSASFLRDAPFDTAGAPLNFEVDASTPGVLTVSATRLQNAQGTATGVNVAGTRTLLSLQFVMLKVTPSSPVTLPGAQREARDSTDTVLPLTWQAGAFQVF